MILEFFITYNPIVLIISIYFAYFIYTRVIRLYYLKWFYEKQGIPCCKEVLPIIGNMARVGRILETYKSNENPWYIMLREDFPEQQPGIC